MYYTNIWSHFRGLNAVHECIICCRWRGSIYKLVWPDLVIFLLLYYTLNFIYRFSLDSYQKKWVQSSDNYSLFRLSSVWQTHFFWRLVEWETGHHASHVIQNTNGNCAIAWSVKSRREKNLMFLLKCMYDTLVLLMSDHLVKVIKLLTE